MSAGQPGPLQIRQWWPYYTLEHAQAGLNPILQPQGQAMVAFGPPVMQYRVRFGAEWSEWQEVRQQREGDPQVEAH